MSESTESPETAPEQASKQTMDILEIMSILPHRYPFLLIDRVVEMERKQRIVAIKNVTMNEPHFQGHFPDYPIMPGVLMVEAIAQTGGALLLTEIPDRDSKLMVFTGIESATVSQAGYAGRSAAHRGNGAELAQPCGEDAGQRHGRWQAGLRCDCDVPGGSACGEEGCNAERGRTRVSIHPTAIVAEGAQIPESCTVGPYCTIGANVVLGEECELVSHVVLDGHLTMGNRNRVFPFACLGVAPQDLKYAGEPTRAGDWRRQYDS